MKIKSLSINFIPHRYHYTFTTFDVETLDLEDFKYNQVNITAFRWKNGQKLVEKRRQIFSLFRFVDSESRHVERTLQEMEDFSPIGSAILNKSGVT